MNRRLVLTQIAVFLVVAVTVCIYAATSLFGIRFTDRPYEVRVDLASAGGLFEGSEVTYRGVRIGRVTTISLKPDGVSATLAVDHGNRIPSDAIATVTRLSAVGEQYLDFRSASQAGPYLSTGDVVPVARTKTPPETASVLASINRLVNSLEPDQLSALSGEVGAAFGGADRDLTTILDSSNRLLEELDGSAPMLRRTLGNADVLLGTFDRHRGDFADFTRAARLVTRTLKERTPQIAQIVRTGIDLSRTLTQVIDENGAEFTPLLANLGTFSRIQAPHLGGWQALLVAIADFENVIPQTVRNGRIQANVLFDYTQPVCRYVTELTSPLSGIRSALRNVRCANPTPGTLQRGADNAPR